jgi:hypothetical protein
MNDSCGSWPQGNPSAFLNTPNDASFMTVTWHQKVKGPSICVESEQPETVGAFRNCTSQMISQMSPVGRRLMTTGVFYGNQYGRMHNNYLWRKARRVSWRHAVVKTSRQMSRLVHISQRIWPIKVVNCRNSVFFSQPLIQKINLSKTRRRQKSEIWLKLIKQIIKLQ